MSRMTATDEFGHELYRAPAPSDDVALSLLTMDVGDRRGTVRSHCW